MKIQRSLAARCGGAIGLCLWTGSALGADTYLFEFTGLNVSIPDGSSAGVSVSAVLNDALPPRPIEKVSIYLGIQSRGGTFAFNGDLYAGITHGSEYAVLLNRTGRRSGSGLGYGDDGFEVWFDDDASQGDVHTYRLELSGSHSVPLGSPPAPLTGSWAPDGRKVNPATVTSDSSRTALLGGFEGMDPNGTWTLFLADWETGGLARLDRWALEITLVPEPEGTAAAIAACLLLGGVWLRSRRTGRAEV